MPDLTQEFFVRVLEGRYLDRADPDRGRWRWALSVLDRVVEPNEMVDECEDGPFCANARASESMATLRKAGDVAQRA